MSQSPKNDPDKVDETARVDEYSVAGDGLSPTATAVDLLSHEHTDPVLDAKMRLVNNAIDEIGFTGFQWKMFVLSGFGYAVDSLILLVQYIIVTQVALEFHPSFPNGLTIAAFSGLLVGAIFWGLSADIIGRRIAFNGSLLICSIFCIICGAAVNWLMLCSFLALSCFGGGGNLVLDMAVFLEYLPSKHQWLLTAMAAWWGVGQLITGFFAWAFLSNFSCIDPDVDPTAPPCTRANNMGWRYLFFSCGALVFVLSILRITVISLPETPKYLIGRGEDAQVVKTLQMIADKYKRPCSLTVDRLEDCGVVGSAHAKGRGVSSEIWVHIRGLYATKRMGLSTTLIWFSWMCIGLAYPLYNVFLPIFLASVGAKTGTTSAYIQWRNYAIVNVVGVFGPIPAGFLCATRIGRRGTMVIGALSTMAFLFGFTTVRTVNENLGFNCAVYFCINIYYGTLYAYTPEVLPSAHRGTGNGIALGLNRVAGILSAVVASVAGNKATAVPIYVCAALYIVMAAVALALPFEPYGRRSS
ncbi:MFS general substrate transporter [Exidia glandulosa HHB12029]|uniref:MFS general substrate transporter n=1 Tax=Exidia glandulosa HHB12029 TaxID=1314781 RepID=A0A165J525_EXIGL|nr:MFS general substrate transporter [Exidia glandulosa HHB12029]